MSINTDILARVPMGALLLTINLALFLPQLSNRAPYASAVAG